MNGNNLYSYFIFPNFATYIKKKKSKIVEIDKKTWEGKKIKTEL